MTDSAWVGTTAVPQDTGDVEDVHRCRSLLFACFLCCVVGAEGYDAGVLNGAAVRIQDHFECSTFHISLLVTVTPLFFNFGALFGATMADHFGRWGTLVICCSMLVGGPLGMALAPSIAWLITLRVLVGLGIGVGFVVVSMYIAEVVPAEMRGTLTVLEDVFLNMGIVLGYFSSWLLLGVEHDWRYMLAVSSIPPALVLTVAILWPHMPESPRWLLTDGREAEAEKVLLFFGGREEAKRAIVAIQEQAERSEEFSSWLDILSPSTLGADRMRLIAGVTVASSQTLCGYMAISYYSSTVLKASTSKGEAFLISALMGVVKLVVAVAALTFIERLGRRPMLLASASMCGLSCCWLACSFGFDADLTMKALGLCFFAAGVSVGVGPVMLVYISEVFDTKQRAKSMALCLTISRLIGAMSTMVFPLAVGLLGPGTTFTVMGFVNGALVALMSLVVPETRGKSLEYMEEAFEELGGVRWASSERGHHRDTV